MQSILKTPTSRAHTGVSAYLLLQRQGKILLQLRQNTGYCDGMWSVVAGHVENNEPATEGMIREAREEIGIELLPHQIRPVHIMHRKSNRQNIDVFFECLSWQGEIRNLEPAKCEKMEFFPLSALPSNLVGYHALVLKYIPEGRFYSELGWKE